MLKNRQQIQYEIDKQKEMDRETEIQRNSNKSLSSEINYNDAGLVLFSKMLSESEAVRKEKNIERNRKRFKEWEDKKNRRVKC